MGDDDPRKIILARRAKFVAAALVSLNAAMCGGETDDNRDGGNPQPCLSPPSQPVDASADTAIPQPCLAPLPPDASDASDDADSDDGG